ncbi:MAG: HD domain-containing protein [Lachnospiraceae bacterium]|nr:HD domain-containing protein [Lachnospiraceae bacterium]
MERCKLQIGCLLIVLYIAFIYYKEKDNCQCKKKKSVFDALLLCGVANIILDGLTAYTVNHLESVNKVLNLILHMCFLISIDAVIFISFIYFLNVTEGFTKKKSKIFILWLPFILNVLFVIINIPMLRYDHGATSNYSMGLPAYSCYIIGVIYLVMTIAIFFKRINYMERNKRVSVFTYFLFGCFFLFFQMLIPESLVSSLATTITILGAYMNLENPAIQELSHYHNEMVIGFATLVENKDDSTGGHIKRTSLYVKLLAEELRNRGYYSDMLSKDYMMNLSLSAPMHDIGKIAIPDAILQKPGKLTNEEFDIMKQHTVKGGAIILDTFGQLGNQQYGEMAFEMARYHHEKWNGKGYPEGKKETEIPLCARIMAIADVFDAVSQKRCYREAMPLEQCFDIIKKGSGQDFDPLLVEIFMDIRDKVEAIYHEIYEEA